MTKAPAFQFYPNDWLSDVQLQTSSATAKGVWINCLCRMWYAPEKGKLTGFPENLTRLFGVTGQEFNTFLEEGERNGFVTVSRNGDGEVTLINRRMYKDAKAKSLAAVRQTRFREKLRSNGKVTPPSSSSSSSSSSLKNKKKYIIKKKTPQEIKQKYLDYVLLTKAEKTSLTKKYGTEKTKMMIERLNNYIGSSGKKYKSHYFAILNWVVKDVIGDKKDEFGIDPNWREK